MLTKKQIKALESKTLDILATTPSAIIIWHDTVGECVFSDMRILLLNASAKLMFSWTDTMEGKNPSHSPARTNTATGHFRMARDAALNGRKGFTGPFDLTPMRPDGTLVHFEYHIMPCCENLYVTVLHDKSAEQVLDARNRATDTPDNPWSKLTQRERKVARLVCRDKTTVEIADELCVSVRTIDNHRANIRRKLDLIGTDNLKDCLGDA